MSDISTLSSREINKHLAWLEYEISLCLEYDLPTRHLESELLVLNHEISERNLRIEIPY